MYVLKNPNLIRIAGRQYPVDVYYTLKSIEGYVDAAMLACLQVRV